MSGPRTPTDQASTGELIAQATADISTLIHDEMQLAKRDLATAGKRVGVGAGLLGLAGTLALYGIAAGLATAVLAIAQGLEPWIAAGIVTLGLFIVAGVAALVGAVSIRRADIDTAKHGATDGDPA